MRASTVPTSTFEDFERVAPLFAALSDATRLQIVTRLSREGPQSISVLTEETAVSRQAVTKHLQVLQDVGLAESWRNGRERIFELKPERLALANQHLDQISRQWDKALGRLQKCVEEEV